MNKRIDKVGLTLAVLGYGSIIIALGTIGYDLFSQLGKDFAIGGTCLGVAIGLITTWIDYRPMRSRTVRTIK